MIEARTPILIGQSGAHVVRVRRPDGFSWIEKTGLAQEISWEATVLNWCAGRLPVAQIIREGVGLLAMTELPGVSLAEILMEQAAFATVEALQLIHAVPIQECPFWAGWDLRLQQAEWRFQAGLVDESDFDKANQGRSSQEVLKELQSFAPLPEQRCFTHGDACLSNFLVHKEKLSGIVDLGRAGITHPAQDWALALRSMRDHFGATGEQLLRQHLPPDCADEELLRRFCLLDELF